MSLIDLAALMPPPSHPFYATGDWEAATREIGTSVPEDYKALTEMYGTGLFCDFLYLITPFAPADKSYNFVSALKVAQEIRTNYTVGSEPAIPFPVFPKENGVLPFAGTANADDLFWVPNDTSPSSWTTRIFNVRDNEWEDFAMGAVDLIYGILSKKIVTRMFPDDIPPRKTSGRFQFYPIDFKSREDETTTL